MGLLQCGSVEKQGWGARGGSCGLVEDFLCYTYTDLSTHDTYLDKRLPRGLVEDFRRAGPEALLLAMRPLADGAVGALRRQGVGHRFHHLENGGVTSQVMGLPGGFP